MDVRISIALRNCHFSLLCHVSRPISKADHSSSLAF